MPRKGSIMPTANELRAELAAKIARPRLLAASAHYAPLIAREGDEGFATWRQAYRDECDAALDEALDATDASIFAHQFEQYSVKV